jgi:hypothetical protein
LAAHQRTHYRHIPPSTGRVLLVRRPHVVHLSLSIHKKPGHSIWRKVSTCGSNPPAATYMRAFQVIQTDSSNNPRGQSKWSRSTRMTSIVTLEGLSMSLRR